MDRWKKELRTILGPRCELGGSGVREWECQEPRMVVAVRNTGPIRFRVNVISASRRECGIKGVRLCGAKRVDSERNRVNGRYAHMIMSAHARKV